MMSTSLDDVKALRSIKDKNGSLLHGGYLTQQNLYRTSSGKFSGVNKGERGILI